MNKHLLIATRLILLCAIIAFPPWTHTRVNYLVWSFGWMPPQNIARAGYMTLSILVLTLEIGMWIGLYLLTRKLIHQKDGKTS